jgi:hypothetical protein
MAQDRWLSFDWLRHVDRLGERAPHHPVRSRVITPSTLMRTYHENERELKADTPPRLYHDVLTVLAAPRILRVGDSADHYTGAAITTTNTVLSAFAPNALPQATSNS